MDEPLHSLPGRAAQQVAILAVAAHGVLHVHT